jgi:hypothetical protein
MRKERRQPLAVDLDAVADAIEQLEHEIDRRAEKDWRLSLNPLEGAIPTGNHDRGLPVLRGILHSPRRPRL